MPLCPRCALQAIALRLLSALARASDAPLVQKLAAYLAAAGTSGGAGALAGILPPVTPSGWVSTPPQTPPTLLSILSAHCKRAAERIRLLDLYVSALCVHAMVPRNR